MSIAAVGSCLEIAEVAEHETQCISNFSVAFAREVEELATGFGVGFVGGFNLFDLHHGALLAWSRRLALCHE